MENEKRLKANKSAIVLSAAYLAMGILLLLFPKNMENMIMVILGLLALAFGIIKMLVGFAGKDSMPSKAMDFTMGIVFVVLGAAVLIFKSRLLAFIPLVFGVFLIISSLSKIRDAIDSHHFNASRWWLSLVFAGISLVFGIILFFRPGFVVSLSFQIIGVFLIIDGVSGLISQGALASSRRVYKKTVSKAVFDAANEPVEEAEFKEVD